MEGSKINYPPPSLHYGVAGDVICPFGMIISVLLFVYVFKYLNINKIIKRILMAITIILFAMYTLMLGVNVVVFHYNYLNPLTCVSVIFLLSGPLGGCILLVIAISVVRYVIFERMTRQRLTDPDLTCAIIAVAFLLYNCFTLVFSYFFVNGTGQDGITVCHTQDLFQSRWWLGLVYLFVNGFIFAVGITADYKMMDLIDDRNENPAQGLQANAHIPVIVSQQQITHEIPKNSSILCGIYAGFGGIVAIIIYNPAWFQESVWLFNALCLAAALVFYPCFIFFAIKKKEDESQQQPISGTNQPSVGLNFHETESQHEANVAFQMEMEGHEVNGQTENGRIESRQRPSGGGPRDNNDEEDKVYPIPINREVKTGKQEDQVVASNVGDEDNIVLPGQVE